MDYQTRLREHSDKLVGLLRDCLVLQLGSPDVFGLKQTYPRYRPQHVSIRLPTDRPTDRPTYPPTDVPTGRPIDRPTNVRT